MAQAGLQHSAPSIVDIFNANVHKWKKSVLPYIQALELDKYYMSLKNMLVIKIIIIKCQTMDKLEHILFIYDNLKTVINFAPP